MKGTPFSWLMELVVNQRRKLCLSMLLAVAYSLLTIVPYMIIYQLVDGFITDTITNSDTVWQLVLLTGAVLLAKMGLQLASGLLSHKAAFQLLFELRQHVVDSVGRLSLGESNKQASASMKKIISDDVDRIETFVAHHLPDMAAAIVSPIVAALLLIYIDWRLAILVLLPLPIALSLQALMFKGFNLRVEEYHRVVSNLHISVVDFVASIPVVKAFNMTVDSHQKYRSAVDVHHKLVTRWLVDTKTPASLFKLSLDLGFLFLLPVGVWLYSQGDVTLSTLFIFMLLGVGLMEPLYNLIQFGGMFSEMLKGVEKIKIFCQIKPQSEGDQYQVISHTNICFNHVSFQHDNSSRKTLDDVSLSVNQGEITAIVGPSGAGKTTVAQLIPRFFEYQSGDISIGGKEITCYSLDQLMSLVSFVFQDVYIFEQSIKENIRMGNEALSDEDIINAAKAACAHDFILELPDGYETKIGQGSLSGGQAQRIAVARAVAKDAPILILDEATAYADARNEVRIQQAISSLMQGRTVLVIAHRLNTLTHVDKIVVMESGRVVSEGTHTELLKDCTLYQSMWQAHQETKVWRLGQSVKGSEIKTPSTLEGVE
ncbi:ABC transporter ATP-binding protein [Photobacterium sanguinicancri]|uniref:ABC transporter ATP-binding protein n=1 Tax=Photobacterium sanguinicancri TaxID=875932 RepID=UPI0007877320|nr:ABC transporter ATP-binding protein [Photobacterium sanguinicancri]KXI24600.1 multidrug ABC transporter permease [Photobacterium sanguinicancri]